MSFVTRYSSIPVSVKENVGEHSYWVALYAAMIHRAAPVARRQEREPRTAAAVVIKALVHDLAECVTGDVVRTFKYSSPALKRAIDEAEDRLLDGFPEPVLDLYEYQEELVEDGGSDMLEQYVDAVVKAADFLSLQQYMNREWLRGNHEIEGFFDRMIVDLRAMETKTAGHKMPQVAALAGLYKAMADSAADKKRYTT